MAEAAETLTATRRLLRRLRDIMAASGSPQDRLDRIVTIVAAEMVAEVCSAYIMRAGEVLELFATEGLRREAVHRTRLRVGEGLVGVIAATARPLALFDAQLHPDFAYRPETGEEVYQSLMGVPLLRGGSVLGVLVVQNRTPRRYSDDEIDALQTIAMVVAELAVSGGLVNPAAIREARTGGTSSLRLDGLRLNPGLAIGPAVLHESQAVIRQIVAEDVSAELDRLRGAVAAMRVAIDELAAASEPLGDGEHRDIIEAYRMFAADRGWVARITEAIKSGLTAEAAAQKVREETRTRMLQVSDPYLRERLGDLEDLANRLQLHLSGGEPSAAFTELPAEFILVARTLGPAELLDYARRRVLGVVLEEGSPTAHVTIVARALGIPMVGRVDEATREIETGDIVVVDGDRGQILLRPSEDLHRSAEAAVEARKGQLAYYQSLAAAPAITRDGVEIKLWINAGLPIDLEQLEVTRAEGVGLFRTELPFMVRNAFPGVEEETEFYRGVFVQARGKPIVFRTLDIGGDKALPYIDQLAEDNPAMGWRAIRIGLDRPAMLRQQLRALIRAAEGRMLFITFPMIAEVSEFDRARALLDMEVKRAKSEGRRLPQSLEVGVVLEVPSLLFQLETLFAKIDFLSLGTNDLAQFLYAWDRGNPRLADRYELLSAPMLGLLRKVLAGAAEANVPVSVCGEMAGNPIESMALIALGFRTLSMAPSAIGPVKTMIRSIDVGALEKYLDAIERRPDHTLRTKLEAYALDHDIALPE